jgi:hypothetical protein
MAAYIDGRPAAMAMTASLTSEASAGAPFVGLIGDASNVNGQIQATTRHAFAGFL